MQKEGSENKYTRMPLIQQLVDMGWDINQMQYSPEWVVRDYNKPMGVATYKTFSDMPKEMQQTLPDLEELKRLMDDDCE